MVNLELVRRGYAQVATYPPDVRWTDELRVAEKVARDGGEGLWGPATPLP
jgi:micrococcal nuclease